MKRILLSLFILLSLSHLRAQTYHYASFPDSGAVWVSTQNCSFYDNSIVFAETQDKSWLLGLDNNLSLYSGYSYRILLGEQKTSSTNGYFRSDSFPANFIREDTFAKRIYIKQSYTSSDILLYDFSKNIGDSLDLFCAGCNNITHTAKIVIKKIDTVNYGSVLRKRFFFDLLNDSNIVIYDTTATYPFIEGIGSKNTLLNPTAIHIMNIDGCYTSLTCYSYMDTAIYPTTSMGACIINLPDGIADVTNIPLIRLYPNPTTDQIHLSISDINGANYRLILTDILGQEVYTSSVNQNESTHDISNLSTGMYTWRVMTPKPPKGGLNTIVGSGKIVKD